jgi:carboxymethylenebutenolidase
MKAVLRVLGIIGIVLLLLIVGVVGYALYDINAGLSAADLTNITIEADDQTLYAYLAEPEGEGPFPGVLMIHEWWGIREDIVKKADTLAAEGYVVLAVDAYRGRVATGIPGALYNTITYPQEQIDADMTAFHAHLVGLDNVDTERIGVMGYCFGGRQTMLFAAQQPGAVQAALTYYGGGQPNTVEELQPLTESDMAVLGVFGAEDGMIPLTEVDTLEASLAELGVTHEITVYDGVGHAFVVELEGDSASAQAWAQGVDFLNTHLAEDTADTSTG